MNTYDLLRGVYMVRRGFLVRDVCSAGGVIYLVDGAGYVCRFELPGGGKDLVSGF